MQKIFSPKTNYWLKTLSKFASVQLVVQALGFASGILLIRNLDKQEYAYFVLANSMQGTMSVLANSGISSALSSIGGKVWQDSYRFGQLIKTAMQFKRYLAIIAVVVVTPILMWMLLKNGASWFYASILILGILIELHFYLSDGVMTIVPRLHSQFDRLQNLGLIAGFTRISLLLGSSLFALNAAVGIFASTIASGLKNRLLFNLSKEKIKLQVPTNNKDRQDIISLVKFQIPSTIFVCLQGQLTVFLISIFGNTENIAEIGALSRLSIIFTLINSIVNNIFIPSFTRCQSKIKIRKMYWQFIGIYIIFSVIMIISSLIFSKQLLWIFGEQYYNLDKEFILMVIVVIITFFSGSLWSLNVSKGWIEKAWLYIPLTIVSQALLILFLDLSSVQGVLFFSIYSLLPSLFVNIYMNYEGLKKV